MKSFFRGVLVGLVAVAFVIAYIAPIVLAVLDGAIHLLWYVPAILITMGCIGATLEW